MFTATSARRDARGSHVRVGLAAFLVGFAAACAGSPGAEGEADSAASEDVATDVAEVQTGADADTAVEDRGTDAVADAADAGCTGAADCPTPSDACAVAACLEGVCSSAPAQDGAPCEDGEICTVGDVCTAGECIAGPSLCDCLTDADCPATDACTGKTVCDTNVLPHRCKVIAGSALACSGTTENPCTKEVCDPKAGACTTIATADAWLDCQASGCTWRLAPPGLPTSTQPPTCDDGDPCTTGDVCDGSVCKAGADSCECKVDADCPDDGNLCNGTPYCDKSEPIWSCKPNPATVVSCDTSGDSACSKTLCDGKTGQCAAHPTEALGLACGPEGCVLAVLPPDAPTQTVACDDGNACTTGTHCKAGACVASANTCKCSNDADCDGKEDGNACNGTLYCDQVSQACKVNPATVISCPNGGDSACSKNVCYPKSGLCQMVAVELTEEVCDGTDCKRVLLPPGKTGNIATCNDDDACTEGEACKAGQCLGGTDTCACSTDADCAKLEDGDFCNGTMYCDKAAQQCKVNPATVYPCKTVGDSECLKHACKPAVDPADANAQRCELTPIGKTTVLCPFPDSPQTCVRVITNDAETQNLPCEDGDVCTAGDVCKGGQCLSGTVVCTCKTDADCAELDDGNVCNGTQYCDLQTGTCAFNPTSTIACKTVDDTACNKAACHPKTGACVLTPIEQTQQFCDSKSGCRREVALSGAVTVVSCEDGQPCTKGDVCAQGICKAGVFTCECATSLDCLAKDDGDLCNGSLYCDKSDPAVPLCKENPASVVTCPPSKDPCLAAICNPANGACGFTPANNGAPCDDDSLCTSSDACKGGLCTGDAVDCDDGSACTNDSCKAAVGCIHAKSNCDDGNTCTADLCDPKTGKCTFVAAADGAGCNADDSGCTVNDACEAGVCKAGAEVQCSLKTEPCEQAICVAKSATQFACEVGNKPKGAPCDDGDACTITSSCSGGVCSGLGKERFFAKDYPSPTGDGDFFGGAAASGGDLVLFGQAVGAPTSATPTAWWVVRVDPAGDPKWQTLLATDKVVAGHRPYAAVAESGGGVWLAGAGQGKGGDLDMRLVRLGAKGQQTFAADFGEAGTDELARALLLDPLGSSTLAGAAGNKAQVLRLAPSGSVVWTFTEAETGEAMTAFSLLQEEAGITVGVSRARQSDGKVRPRILRLDAQGKLLQRRDFELSAASFQVESLLDNGADLLLAGWAGSADKPTATLMGVTRDGRQRWLDQGDEGTSWRGAASLDKAGFAVVGTLTPLGGADTLRLRGIDALGNEQWQRLLDADGAAQPRALLRAGGDLVAVGALLDGGKRVGRIVRTDAWGHDSCLATGACLDKAVDACVDDKACTVDSCDGSKGCTVTPLEKLRCDPGDECSQVSACGQGQCAQTAEGRLGRKVVPGPGAGVSVLEDDDGDLMLLGGDSSKATLTRVGPWGTVRWTADYAVSSIQWRGMTRLSSGTFVVAVRDGAGNYSFKGYDRLGNSVFGAGGSGSSQSNTLIGVAAVPGGFVTCHYDDPNNNQSWRMFRLGYWNLSGSYTGKKEQKLWYYDGTWKKHRTAWGSEDYGGSSWWRLVGTACAAAPNGYVHVIGTAWGHKYTGCDAIGRHVVHAVFPTSGGVQVRLLNGTNYQQGMSSWNFTIPTGKNDPLWHWLAYAKDVTALADGGAVIAAIAGRSATYPNCNYGQAMTSVDRLILRTAASGAVQWSSKANDGGEFDVRDVTPHLGGVVLAGSVKTSGGTFPRYEHWTGPSSMVPRNLSINDAVYAASSTASGDLVVLGQASGGWLLQRFDRWYNVGCAAAGACAAHGDDACDDQDACTADACDTSKGCVHTPIGGCGG